MQAYWLENIFIRLVRSYIFTFDSLGSKHPAAVRNLQTYLQMEARDKKNLECALTTPPLGKNAIVSPMPSFDENPTKHHCIFVQVPAQPNFCDCGVYLLHFVKIFLQNPTVATERILVRPSRRIVARALPHWCLQKKTRLKEYTSKERDDDWDNEKVSELREALLKSAGDLSEEWKKDRAAKEEQKKKEVAEVAGKPDVIEDSDDDIVVSEVVVKAKPGKGKGKGKMKALPVGGETKADRLR